MNKWEEVYEGLWTRTENELTMFVTVFSDYTEATATKDMEQVVNQVFYGENATKNAKAFLEQTVKHL